jgi:hypothetical protein
MNPYIGPGVKLGGQSSFYPTGMGGFRIFLRTASFTDMSPAECWLILDEHPDSIDDAFFGFGSTGETREWTSLAGSTHSGATTLVFNDGHSEVKKWLEPETKHPVRYNTWVSHQNPASKKKLDYYWLLQRTSVRPDGKPVTSK